MEGLTTRQKFEKMLFERGMFEAQASKVMDLAIPKLQELVVEYQITWDKPANKYPEAFYNVAFITVKEAALEWIDTNLPRAWFRAMFV